MSEYRGVTVVREANVYFEEKVTSRVIKFNDGSHMYYRRVSCYHGFGDFLLFG
ncbi:MAG: hypothetical protein WA131_08090 [Desulfitobacteriaceae bacterium]